MDKVKRLIMADFDNEIDYWQVYLPNLTVDTIKQIPSSILENLVDDLSQDEINQREDEYINRFELSDIPTSLVENAKNEEVTEDKTKEFFDNVEKELNGRPEEPVVDTQETISKEVGVEETKEIVKEVVTTIKKDLFNLTVVDAPVSTVKMNYDAFLSKTLKSTYYVVLPVSGYSANVRGMSVEELDSVKTSSTSNEDRMDILSRIIYSCILDTSVGKMTFETYVENTAQTELPILLFGIMIKTFGHINTINYKCGSCGEVNKGINLDLNSLMQIKTDKVTEIMRLIDLKEEPEKFIKDSLLKTLDIRFELPESKIVVSAKFGNLEKDITLTRFRKHLNIKDGNLIAELLHFVDSLFIPVFDKSGTQESGNYAMYTKTADIYNYLKNMSLEDLRVFAKEMSALDDYQINFNRKINCTHCRKENDISVDIIPNFYYSIFQEMM